MNLACKTNTSIFTPNSIIEFVTIIFFVTYIFLCIKTTQGIKKIGKKIIIWIGLFLSLSFIWLITCFLIAVNSGIIDDNPPSEPYHPLNAMIKYRCYQDHAYCPLTDAGVRTIAPDYLKSELNNAQITYSFDQKTKNYTLIIRNNNYHFNNDRAVIFDPRLKHAKEYGNHGLDFFDADIVSNCNGTFRITNPPPFPGPWNQVK